jgi:hypothetical protein
MENVKDAWLSLLKLSWKIQKGNGQNQEEGFQLASVLGLLLNILRRLDEDGINARYVARTKGGKS